MRRTPPGAPRRDEPSFYVGLGTFEPVTAYRGRFAPSPTGDLHVGSAAAALVAWLSARSAGGAFVLRVEDIDTPRVVSGVEQRQLDDLRWLGLDWDEGPDVGGAHAPYRQSERSVAYELALAELAREGHLYWCDCSRAEIARSASAPHAGDDGPRYPGTCRAHVAAPPEAETVQRMLEGGEGRRGERSEASALLPPARPWRRPPALRVRVPDREVVVEDALQGTVRENVWQSVGDFVVKRADGIYAYQLAVVVDDLAMKITEVVRGADLLSSAPRQAALASLLGGAVPSFAHLALVLAADGKRLAKRERGTALRDHRETGRRPEEVVGMLARMLGLVDPVSVERGPLPTPSSATSQGRLSPRELLASFDRSRLRGIGSVRVPGTW